MKTKTTIIALLFLIILPIYSQEHPVPPIRSPQVADIIRYDNTPIAKNSGRLDLNIPLLDLEGSTFKFPISINYNSSGFVPSKPETCVGLNWSLIAGGVIYREIRGMPDDIDKDYNFIDKRGFLHIIKDNLNYNQNNVFNNPAQYLFHMGDRYYFKNTSVEVTSDIYHFSFGNHQGKFMIGMDGKPKVDSKYGGRYEIDLTDYIYYEGNFNGTIIRITTDDGYVYWFGGSKNNTEYTIQYSGGTTNASPVMSANSFHLYKIVAPNGEELNIKYKAIPDNYNASPRRIIYENNLASLQQYRSNFILSNSFNTSLTIGDPVLIQGPTGWTTPTFNIRQTTTTYSLTKVALIDEVTYGNQKIKFHYSEIPAGREKYDSNMVGKLSATCGAMLDSINVSYKDTIIKTVSLQYHFMDKSSPRFVVNKIILTDGQTYNFGYNDNFNLPSPTTTDIDYWNFWRNKDPDNFPIPQISIDNNGDFTYSSGEREPADVGYDATLLNQITFPTGGKAYIEYEKHTYSRSVDRISGNQFKPGLINYDSNLIAGGARVRSITYNDNGQQKKIGFEYTFDKINRLSSGVLNYFPKYVSMNHYYFIYTSGNPTIYPIDPPTVTYGSIGMNVSSYEKDHISYSNVIETIVEAESGGEFTLSSSVQEITTGEVELSKISIEKGMLKWKVCGMTRIGNAIIYLKQDNQIRETIEISGDNPYYYEPDLPSGDYTIVYTKSQGYGFYIQLNIPKGYRGPYSITTFTDYSSNPDQFGDDKVIERFSNYSYTNYQKYYFRDAQDCSQERGLLSKIESYKSDSKLVERTEYFYRDDAERFNNYALTHKTYRMIFDQLNKIYFYPFFLTKEVKSQFVDNYNVPVVSSKEYKYNSEGYLTEEMHINSDGKTKKNTNKYPFDYSSAVYNQMVKENIVSPVIEKTEFYGTNNMYKITKNYRYDNNLAVINDIQTSYNDDTQTNIIFHRYNHLGKPVYVSVNDEKVAYLWAFNGLYRIADIKNATLDDVEKAVSAKFGTYIDGLLDKDNETLNNVESLRQATSLKDALINTYSYKPLIGVCEEGDNTGYLLHYNYDNWHRLNHTYYDKHQKYIIEKYDYKHKNK